MRKLVVVALLGSLAQLVDGTLGMAYGVTATTTLLVAGITPAVASASVHLSEVGTTLASGISHWRFGHVDWRVVGLIGVPGGDHRSHQRSDEPGELTQCQHRARAAA